MATTKKKAAKKTVKKRAEYKARDSVHTWLRENGFKKVADQIAAIMLKWKRKGLTTRRNWYDVLAYGETIEGIEFKVIPAALARQKKLAKLKESAPAKKAKPSKKASKKTKKPAKKAGKKPASKRAPKAKVYKEAPKVQGVSEWKGDPKAN